MIRFAPQTAKQPVVTPEQAQPGAVSTAKVAPLAGLLADGDDAPGATPVKTRPRSKKQKSAEASATVQLELDS